MSRAEYARLRALVDLRLDELRVALDRHEAEHQDERAALVATEIDLASITARLAEPHGHARMNRAHGL